MVTSVAASKLQAALREMRSLRNEAADGTAEAGKIPATAVNGTSQSRPPAEAVPDIDPEMLQSAVEEIEQNVQTVARSLQFSVDEASGRTIITVIDRDTDEVIRQIPPKEVLAIAERLNDPAGGLLVQAEV